MYQEVDMAKLNPESVVILQKDDLAKLLNILRSHSYQTIGPTLRENAIVYDEIQGMEDLPIGWTDSQEKGSYRLEKRNDDAYFGYNVGPYSWKTYLSPARVRVCNASRSENGFNVVQETGNAPNYAFIGVRPCDVKAIKILDKVFINDFCVDNVYGNRRKQSFIVAVNCTEAGNTCFCSSMGTGPKSEEGFDLCLTEIVTEQSHFFVTEIGSDKALEVLEALSPQTASESEIKEAERRIENAAQSMGRNLNTDRIHDLMFDNYRHPQWDDIAERCLSCANCTMVCPTCFCNTVEEKTDLEGDNAERWRIWDSCFTLEYSYIHGGSVRHSTKSRYRQWMTHKLASWHDQFDTSGCVGCGRCITWCPVGIDITEEVSAIRNSSTVPEETVDQPR
ncbi:4Fe-4S dicluster domain-containing protein [Rhodohalobacter sulfatireducens]|nr:4Fe-4S dicluster domain-containing protein [Rhodohalobacter sulfatireducens]